MFPFRAPDTMEELGQHSLHTRPIATNLLVDVTPREAKVEVIMMDLAPDLVTLILTDQSPARWVEREGER